MDSNRALEDLRRLQEYVDDAGLSEELSKDFIMAVLDDLEQEIQSH